PAQSPAVTVAFICGLRSRHDRAIRFLVNFPHLVKTVENHLFALLVHQVSVFLNSRAARGSAHLSKTVFLAKLACSSRRIRRIFPASPAPLANHRRKP